MSSVTSSDTNDSPTPAWVLTGGFAESGAPAFFDLRAQAWRPLLSRECVIDDRQQADSLLGEVGPQEAIICDAYVIPVLVRADDVAPTSARERIRAGGADVVLRRLGLEGFAPEGTR